MVVTTGKTLAGFIIGIILGIEGGWITVIFNATGGHPWALTVRQNMYLVGIGLGAGGGALLWVDGLESLSGGEYNAIVGNPNVTLKRNVGT